MGAAFSAIVSAAARMAAPMTIGIAMKNRAL
jgi:hypothetical protein